jgi:hypothetical protein
LAGLQEEVGRMAAKIGHLSSEEARFQGGKQS